MYLAIVFLLVLLQARGDYERYYGSGGVFIYHTGWRQFCSCNIVVVDITSASLENDLNSTISRNENNSNSLNAVVVDSSGIASITSPSNYTSQHFASEDLCIKDWMEDEASPCLMNSEDTYFTRTEHPITLQSKWALKEVPNVNSPRCKCSPVKWETIHDTYDECFLLWDSSGGCIPDKRDVTSISSIEYIKFEPQFKFISDDVENWTRSWLKGPILENKSWYTACHCERTRKETIYHSYQACIDDWKNEIVLPCWPVGLAPSSGSSYFSIFGRPQGSPSHKFIVMDYYFNIATYLRDFQVYDIEFKRLTHLVYSFFVVDKMCRIVSSDEYADFEKIFPEVGVSTGNFGLLKIMKIRFPHIRMVLAIGGWGKSSSEFSPCVETDKSRDVLVESILELIETHKDLVDAISLNWLHPGCCGSKYHTYHPDDWSRYAMVIKKLKNTILHDYPRKELYISVGSRPEHLENNTLNEICQDIELVQVMTFDYAGPWDDYTGLISPLSNYHKSICLPHVSASIDAVIQAGCPASKTLLGITPFGRTWNWKDQPMNPLNEVIQRIGVDHSADTYDSNSWSEHGTWRPGLLSFVDIISKIVPYPSWYKNMVESQSYAYEPTINQFVSYEDHVSVRQKIYYAKSLDLAGVFRWNIIEDSSNEILTEIDRTFNDKDVVNVLIDKCQPTPNILNGSPDYVGSYDVLS
eukprot:GHVL01023934.1.p1 GENE.GHVL01023934.1~~GHVL01023934.1.p1  ORF type:complete len:695 (-),score=66.89 GHVL01023934.1:492-2576(-)